MQASGYCVTVTFDLVAGHEDEFMAAMVANARRSLTVEPGCRVFDVCLADSGREVFLYEIYESRAAFDAHLQADHFLQFDAVSRSWVQAKTVRTYNLIGEAAQ